MAKTVGLLTTGLWHSFSREMFEGVRAETEKRGISLVTFLGNELRSKSAMTGLPELANSLYRLVGPQRLDGLLVWTGNLGNYVEPAELEEFLVGFGLPLVTIGRKVLDFPNIIQDEEAGARRVMDHLFDHHGARKVFFLRGPGQHPGCEFRYQGYRRSLVERGMAVDEALVSPALGGWEELNGLYFDWLDRPPRRVPSRPTPPHDWVSAHPEEQSAVFFSLLAERNLVPGEDFDTVVAATDVLAAIAIRQLNQAGYLVPSDVRVVGLDGDDMARDILPLALSTLPLNLGEQGAAAVTYLASLLEGEQPPELTVTISQPVWGSSCGCLPAPFGTEPGLSPEAERDLKAALAHPGQEVFLDRWIRETRRSPPQPGRDATDRMRFLWDLHPALKVDTRLAAEAWIQQAIAEGRGLAVRQRERKMKLLFDIGQSLSSRFDRQSMVEALVDLLPRLGLSAFSLALYADPLAPEGGLEVLAARSRQGDLPVGSLPSRLLAPDAFFDSTAGRTMVVEPLYTTGGLLGVLVLEHVGGFDSEFYHHVGTQVSASLKGALLKEEITASLETLNQAQMNLREKEKLAVLGGLAAGVVHEVNTPLGAILSVNGVLEGLTSDLIARATEAAPFLPSLSAGLVEFLTSLPPSGTPVSRVQRREFKLQLEGVGIPEADAEEEARFLGEAGFAEIPSGWLPMVGGPGGAPVFRLIETLADIRRTASINKQASTKMENYLKAIRSYIYRDRDHTSSSRVDVCQTLDTVLTLNSARLNKGVKVQRGYLSEPAVEGWGEALIQVWNNLVSNALFAMGETGVLAVEVSERAGWAVVRIADTGPGIPVEIHDRVFEDFFTTKPIGIGTGLGLGIVRQIVHDHQGTIEFESGPGHTVFTVRLPALKPLSLP